MHTDLLRPRLLRVLDGVLDAGSAVLVAPQGYGKSTLLRQWCDQDRETGGAVHVCMELHEEHNDPRELLRLIASTAAEELPGLSVDAHAPLGAAQFERLVRAADPRARRSGDRPLVLVFDAYERIHEPGAHEVFSLAMDALPHDVHVVLASDAPVPFLMGARRARGTIVEITANDLAFTQAEAAEVLGCHVSEAALVLADTRGWPVGVSLASRRVEAAALVAEYVHEEMLLASPAPLAQAMLDLSVVERWDDALAARLLDDADAGATLAQIEGQGRFPVSADSDGLRALPPVVRRALAAEATRRDGDRVAEVRRRHSHVTSGVAELSARELEVLRELDSERPIATIAKGLGISYHTAKTHVRSIYGKLDTGTRTGAVRAAREAGYLD